MMKNLVIWLVIGLVLMTVFNQFNSRQTVQAPMEYSQFIEEVKAKRFVSDAVMRSGQRGVTVAPPWPNW